MKCKPFKICYTLVVYGSGIPHCFVLNQRYFKSGKFAACISTKKKDKRKDGQFLSDTVYVLFE